MKVRNVINLLDFLQVSSKGSKLGLEEASSGEKLSSLARLSKDGRDQSFSLTVLLNGRRGSAEMEQPACKNLYCLFWFTCAIRTSD